MSEPSDFDARAPLDPRVEEHELDRRQVRRSFARAALRYEQHHALQVEVGTRLRAGLPVLRAKPQTVLDVGAGTGLGSLELQQRYPQARLFALDLALPMLQAARSKDRDLSCVCADARSLPFADGSIDLLHSSLCIQWIRDPQSLFLEFRRVLRTGGTLAISTLGPATLKELRQAWKSAGSEPRVGHFKGADLLRSALSNAGFEQARLTVALLDRRFESPRALLQELKGLGATGAESGRPKALTGKATFSRMSRAYEAMASDGTIPSTWEVIYIQG